jgi:hypothetical protein
VIEKSLAGPVGLIVKASTLRDYGVDNFFFLENKNADTSQRNVVFISRGESAQHAQTIAGQSNFLRTCPMVGRVWLPPVMHLRLGSKAGHCLAITLFV